MVQLEAVLEAPQDRDRVLRARRLDHDRLEPALQGRVLFDVLSVLIEGRRPDAVQFATGEHGLEQVSRIHGALGLAGPDNEVQLVYEKDDAAVALLDLLEHGLQPLLEFAAVFGAGDQGAHVEGKDRPVLQAFGHVAAQDALGQPFDDRGLSNARLADEDRVVLGLSRKDPDRAADLLVAPDHRVELALAGLRHEVDAVLLQGLVGRLGVLGRHALVAADFPQGLHDLRPVEAETLEKLPHGLGPADLEQAQKQVFRADKLVLQRFGLLFGPRQDIVHGLRHKDLGNIHAARDPRQPFQLPVHGQLKGARREAELLDKARDDPLFLAGECGQQVPGVHLRVIEAAGNALRVGDRLARHLGEFGQIHGFTLACPGPKRELPGPEREPLRPCDTPGQSGALQAPTCAVASRTVVHYRMGFRGNTIERS